MCALAAALLLLPAPARMMPVAAQSAMEISVDELIDDSWGNRVIARGNVEIRFFGEILLADEVIYDRRGRKLSARGNVVLQDAEGKVSRAGSMNLHDDLRDAFVAYARRQKMRIDP
jgi:lipopolysaccharide assembly outer membrane protein LptD (OstA)